MKTVKLHIMSDLHVDHHQHDGGKAFIETISAESQPDEVLIIAGDLFDGFRDLQKCKERMRKIAKGWKHVVYVMGNHEFLSHTPAEALEAAWNTCAGVDNLSLL